MAFPTLWIIVDTISGKWLGNATQRNKTSAELTSTGAPRLFTKRSAATQAMIWWQQGVCYYEYSINGHQDEPGGFELKSEPRWLKSALEVVEIEVVEIELVMEEDYTDVF